MCCRHTDRTNGRSIFCDLLSVFHLFSAPPIAPVVTRRPPIRLTGGRCHAAPGVLASVSMFGGVPPRPVRLVVLGLVVGEGA